LKVDHNFGAMTINTCIKPLTNISWLILFGIIFPGCKNSTTNTEYDKKEIASMLDSFNNAAAKADYTNYFKNFTEDAVFIGTDATEHWDKQHFMVWAKPYFDRGKAWNFKSIDRHIYLDEDKNLAWFDELLSTQMKICRGSGVVVRKDNEWKIQQYVLSMTIPNNLTGEVLKLKTPIEDSIISVLTK
jgi:SnoaL-like domain